MTVLIPAHIAAFFLLAIFLVTAMISIIGYSVNDARVSAIFGRISLAVLGGGVLMCLAVLVAPR